MTIRPYSEAWMPVNISLLDNKDFIFYPILDAEAVTF